MPQSTTLFVSPPVIDPKDYVGVADRAKVADMRLSSPPMHWVDEVTQALIRAHPYIPPERIIVNFKERDDAAGYAIGFVSIQGAPRISIPVIIAQRRLKPLDILIRREEGGQDAEGAVGDFSDDEVLPLTQETFGEAMDGGEPGELVQPNELRHTLGWSENANALRLPYRGRTAIAEVVGASDAKKAELQEVLSKHREVVAGFAAQPLGRNVLDSWLQAPPPSHDIQAKLAARETPAAEALFLQAVPEETKTSEIMAAHVVLNDGTIKAAVAFDAVDLSNPGSSDRFLVFEDGSYCRSPVKVSCADTGATEDSLAHQVVRKMAATGLQRGDTISMQLSGEFTAPAKIASILHDQEHNALTLELTTGLGVKYPVMILPDTIKTATLNEEGVWLVPASNRILHLGSYADERQQPMPSDKLAAQVQAQFPDSLICAGGQYTLTIGNEDFGVNQVDEAKCAAVLSTWFENGPELLRRVKEAASADPEGTGCVRFDSDLRDVVLDVCEKTAAYRQFPEVATAWIEKIALPMEKAAALASSLSDPEGADAVLSTGFLSEDNLSEFAGLADDFKQVVSKLARLLLLLRMGHQEGDEAATLVAMKSLQRVAESLSTMGSMASEDAVG